MQRCRHNWKSGNSRSGHHRGRDSQSGAHSQRRALVKLPKTMLGGGGLKTSRWSCSRKSSWYTAYTHDQTLKTFCYEDLKRFQSEYLKDSEGTKNYLAWKIPWTEEPGRLQSMGSLRVGHDRVTSLSLFTFMHWRRKWQPTPVFLPGESQGWGSLLGCRLWGRTESDTTEMT